MLQNFDTVENLETVENIETVKNCKTVKNVDTVKNIEIPSGMGALHRLIRLEYAFSISDAFKFCKVF